MANNIAMLTLATKIDNASINKTVNQLSKKVQDGMETAFAGVDKQTSKLFEDSIGKIEKSGLKNVNLTAPFKELANGLTTSKNPADLTSSIRKFAATIDALSSLTKGTASIGGMMPTLRSLDNSQMARLTDSLMEEQQAKQIKESKKLNGKTAEDLFSDAEAKSIDELIKKYPKAQKEAETFKEAILNSDKENTYSKDSSSISEYAKLYGLLKEMENHVPKKDSKDAVSYGKEMQNVFSLLSDYESNPEKYSISENFGEFLKTSRYGLGSLSKKDAYYQYRGVSSAEEYINKINSDAVKQKTDQRNNLIRKLQEEVQRRGERVNASYEKWKASSSNETPDAKKFKNAQITVEQYDAALKNLKETLEGFYSAYENGEDLDLAEMKGAMDLYEKTGIESQSWFKKYKEAYEDLAFGEKVTPSQKTLGDYFPTDGVGYSEYEKIISDADQMKSALSNSKAEAESLKSEISSLNSELEKANSLIDELSASQKTNADLNTEGSYDQLEKEALGADEVKKAMDSAAQAKNEFAAANEKVRASAEQSSASLQAEALKANEVSNSMNSAAQSKNEFVAANEKAQVSVNQDTISSQSEIPESNDDTKSKSSSSRTDSTKRKVKNNSEAAKERRKAKQQTLYDRNKRENERYSAKAKAELKKRLEAEKKAQEKAAQEAKEQEEKRRSDILNGLDTGIGSYQKLSNQYYSLKEKSLLGKTDGKGEAELLNIEKQREQALKNINSLLEKGNSISLNTSKQQEKLASIKNINKAAEADLNDIFSREALKKYYSKTNRIDQNKSAYGFVEDDLSSLHLSASRAGSLDDIERVGSELDKIYDKYKRYNALSKGTILQQDVNMNTARQAIDQIAREDNSKILKLQQLSTSENGITKFVAEVRNADYELQKMYITYDDTINKMSYTKSSKGFERTGILGFIDEIKDKSSYLSAQFISQFFDFGDIVGYIREGVEKVKDLDTAFIEMQKVSNDSTASLKSFADQSFDTSKNIGTTAVDLQSSAADWMRIGESIDEASKSAEATSILKNVSEFDNIEDATSSLVSMSQAYSNLDKMDIVDKMNELGNNYAISTDELSKGLQDSASTLSLLGNSIDESAAIITAGNTIIQNVSSVAAGARTIALRLVGTEAAKEQLSDMGEATDDSFITQTSAKKRQIIMDYTKTASNGYKGFDILDNNGNYKNTYDILLGISEIYKEIQADDKKFGSNRASALIEEMANASQYVQKCA